MLVNGSYKIPIKAVFFQKLQDHPRNTDAKFLMTPKVQWFQKDEEITIDNIQTL